MSQYNGWSNYETWNCKLWLDNDQDLYFMVREWADTQDKIQLADSIKELVEDSAPDLDASMYADMLNAALSEIDYIEIAESIIDEL